MVQVDRYKVPAEKLRWHCDPELYHFECTEELAPLEEFIGQPRALKALEFGLGVERSGYNIFVTGLSGTGKASVIKSYLEKDISRRKERGDSFYPDDWVYLHNLEEPDRPLSMRLPPGKGKVFKAQMEGLLKTLREAIIRTFTGEEYEKRKREIAEEGQRRSQLLLQAMEKESQEAGFLLQIMPMGVSILPLVNGKPIHPQDYVQLPEETRQEIEARQKEIMRKVQEAFEKNREVEKETAEKVKELDRKVGEATVSPLFNGLLKEYARLPEVVKYLESVRAFILENVHLFREVEAPPPVPPMGKVTREKDPTLPFQVNLFVDNSGASAPPILDESHPTWINLFGAIERRPYMGTYISDHTMFKAGAVQRANGGYLILNIRDLLLNPGVWEGLKRVIKTKEARLEDPIEHFGLIPPQGLRPYSIPLDLKVIITGDLLVYHLLATLDEDFWEMFKVKADFDFQIDRTVDNTEAYARFICGVCQRDKLLPFDRGAVAKVVEHGAQIVADQERLSSRFGQIRDILIEADYWARKSGDSLVRAEHVTRALEEKVYRSDLIAERIRRLIAEGTIMVDVDGEVVGQVNGLAVYDLGDFSFGRPSRITAKTFMGRRGVINIERESQLSGHIHDKGVLILSGYLGWKFAQDKPLALSASVCFEQSYEGVEGDSASSTELYAILSSLSGIPVKQEIAITGSVNQKGEIQPIGGVNQKIEGFFDVCKAKGFTGRQGVIIPQQNVRNLMLREDVVEAVKEGKFHIYAVRTIDEGMEVLAGVTAGGRRPDGTFPQRTVNHAVNKHLKELAEGIRAFLPEEIAGRV